MARNSFKCMSDFTHHTYLGYINQLMREKISMSLIWEKRFTLFALGYSNNKDDMHLITQKYNSEFQLNYTLLINTDNKVVLKLFQHNLTFQRDQQINSFC